MLAGSRRLWGIAICGDDIRDQKKIIYALHSWNLLCHAEYFINDKSLCENNLNKFYLY